MNRNKPTTLFSMLLVAAFLCSSCNSNENSTPSENPSTMDSTPAVEAVQARYGSLPLSERLSGTVISRNQVELYPQISGRVTEVLVESGQTVQKGDALVQLDDRQYREQVEQARAGLRIAEAQLKQSQARLQELEAQFRRVSALAEKDVTSQMELETIQAQMASAEADVDLAEAQLDQAQSTLNEQQNMLERTVVRAPVDGTVGQRNAEPGMQVSTGTHLFTIGDLSRLRVEVVLTEEMLSNIETGQTARIYLDGEDGPQYIDAKLARISPFLNPVARSTRAEIDVQNNDNRLRPGMFVPVDILYGESRQATLIPTSALYSDPNTGEEGVFTVPSIGAEVEPLEEVDPDDPPALTDPLGVEFQPVEVIAQGQMEVAVSPIDPGTWVVTVGQDLLSVGRNEARVRTISWERILALQGLQRQDLLNRVLEEQQNTQGNQPTL